MRRAARSREFLVLGHAAGAANKTVRRKLTELAVLLSRLATVDIAVSALETYDELTQTVWRGEVDLAWLPPIPFLALHAQGVVVPLAAVRSGPYESAIVVPRASRLAKPASLVGKRAGWVDRHSAAGFVVPRIKLARLGIDPRTAFRSERFFGTHAEVVRAVASGAVDFGATYARPSLETVRAIATFGRIPPDVVAARASLDKDTRKLVVRALKALPGERDKRWLVRDVFGTEGFFRPEPSLYAPLHDAVAMAYHAGILRTEAADPDAFDVAKTLEIRPGAAARAASLDPDRTDEADVIEVIEPSNPEIRLRPLGVKWRE